MDLGKGMKLEMVLIPAGEFMMGSPDSDKDAADDEKPQHRVRITKPFYLGKYPVTQEQWEAVMGNNPSHFKGPKNPVEKVSWDDCQQFLGKLNAKVGQSEAGSSQLPTEAQWEYACRAGSTTKYCFGDDERSWANMPGIKKLGRQAASGGREEAECLGALRHARERVGVVPGLVDDGYYAKSPLDDPIGPATGSLRVYHGGGWGNDLWYCRSACRGGGDPKFRQVTKDSAYPKLRRTSEPAPASPAPAPCSAASEVRGPPGPPTLPLYYCLGTRGVRATPSCMPWLRRKQSTSSHILPMSRAYHRTLHIGCRWLSSQSPLANLFHRATRSLPRWQDPCPHSRP